MCAAPDPFASTEDAQPGRVMSHTPFAFNRRRFLAAASRLGGGLAALAGAGAVGYEIAGSGDASHAQASTGRTATRPDDSATSTAHRADAQSFRSAPALAPPRISVAQPAGNVGEQLAGKYVMLTPQYYETKGVAQSGVMITDPAGQLVWFAPRTDEDSHAVGLEVQTYRGRPVLTWFEGKIITGYGAGVGKIVDSSYRPVATIQAGNGLRADLHELHLTDRGTALITAYRSTTADLTKVGGDRHGKVVAGQAQEIDVATGKLLWSWDSLDHVPVTETYAKPEKGVLDYFHINSVSLASDGNVLISARNTWALYKVDRNSGQVIWRLNGRQSDFRMGHGTRFYWQHHSRDLGGGVISLFDDGAAPAEEAQSRGLVLSVDESAKTVTLLHAFTHPARLRAQNQGSIQYDTSTGSAFVGWGNQPYYSLYDASGKLLLDARLPPDVQSYRAFLSEWSGHPVTEPAIRVTPSTAGGDTVFASWNGATEVGTWRVLGGQSAASLAVAAEAPRTGFETAITVSVGAKHYAVEALDRQGMVLRRSKVVAAPPT